MKTIDNPPPSASKTGGRFPDFTVCRVAPAGVSRLQYCLLSKPADCPYAERHADKTFCFFPDPSRFGSKTA